MDWRQFIKQVNITDKETGFDFNGPITEPALHDLKTSFLLDQLPDELEELLRQTDGIDEKLNGEIIGELIWNGQRIIEMNIEYRKYPDFKELYMSFDQLFFFSGAGNGDLFAFVTLNGKFDRNDIFVWNHEDDSRVWVAPNLAKFIEGWISGKIKV